MRYIFKEINFSNNGTPINITGSTIVMTVRKKPEDSKIISQGTANLTNPTGWVATITLQETDFLVENGTYFYDIKWTDSAGIVTTFMKWSFEISYNVT